MSTQGKGEMTTYWLIGRDDSIMTNEDKIDSLSAKKHIHILTNGDAQIRNLEVTLQDVEAGSDAYTSLPGEHHHQHQQRNNII